MADGATRGTSVGRNFLTLAFTRRLQLPMTRPGRFRQGLIAGAVMAAVVIISSRLPVLVTITIGAAVYLGVLYALGGLRFRRGALPELSV